MLLTLSFLIKVSGLLHLIKSQQPLTHCGDMQQYLLTDPSMNLWVCLWEPTPRWTQLRSKVRVEGQVSMPKQRCRVEGQVTALWRMHSLSGQRLLLDRLSNCQHDGSSVFGTKWRAMRANPISLIYWSSVSKISFGDFLKRWMLLNGYSNIFLNLQSDFNCRPTSRKVTVHKSLNAFIDFTHENIHITMIRCICVFRTDLAFGRSNRFIEPVHAYFLYF